MAGLTWRKDYRFNENRGRNYLPRGNRKSGLLESFKGFNFRESMASRSSSANATGAHVRESQAPVALPKLQANVKHIFVQADGDRDGLVCEIYVYKDEKLHLKLKRDYQQLLELEQFIRVKYHRKYIESGLMTLSTLPTQDKFDLQNMNSKEAFKRAINFFFASLLTDS